MREPLHWPPGAPMLFAAGYKLFGSDNDKQDFDIGAVYWQQALITTGTTALAIALGWILVGPWAGLLGGLIVGTYPPLIGATGDQLSEPLGAFLLLAAFVALALAVKRRSGPLGFAAAGALFGLTILTRTDLLPVPFLIAGFGGAIVLYKQRSLKPALLRWGMVAIAAAVVLAPWTIYASAEEGRFIPVTKGSAAALFVGTYLPGDGTTMGMKMHLEDELRRRHPEYDDMKTYKIPAADALEIFAERYPDLPRDEALQKQARKNLIHYSTTEPVAFAQMQWAKAKRMWFFYYRGGGVHYISTPMRIWQVFLVLACGAGLLAGLIRRRDPVLGAVLMTVLFSTAIHTIVVSQARYNVPLMPTPDRRRRGGLVPGAAPESEHGGRPCDDAGMELGQIGIWRSRNRGSADAAGTIERLGFGALWIGGSPSVDQVRPYLEASSRLPVITGILNVWQHEPADVAAAHARITADYPDRFLLGIGIGHPEATSDYTRPLTAMREFFDGLDAAEAPVPRDERLLAALGPKMLDLAKERSLGTHPYFITLEHTFRARERLGEDALVAPEVAVVLDPNPESARKTAREYATLYLGLSNYTKNLLEFGFTRGRHRATAARTA